MILFRSTARLLSRSTIRRHFIFLSLFLFVWLSFSGMFNLYYYSLLVFDAIALVSTNFVAGRHSFAAKAYPISRPESNPHSHLITILGQVSVQIDTDSVSIEGSGSDHRIARFASKPMDLHDLLDYSESTESAASLFVSDDKLLSLFVTGELQGSTTHEQWSAKDGVMYNFFNDHVYFRILFYDDAGALLTPTSTSTTTDDTEAPQGTQRSPFVNSRDRKRLAATATIPPRRSSSRRRARFFAVEVVIDHLVTTPPKPLNKYAGNFIAQLHAIDLKKREGSPYPIILKKPVLQGGSKPDMITFTWETDHNYDVVPLVRIWEEESGQERWSQFYETTQLDYGHFVHSAVVTHLKPETKYRYQVCNSDDRRLQMSKAPVRWRWREQQQCSDVYSFKTLPEPILFISSDGGDGDGDGDGAHHVAHQSPTASASASYLVGWVGDNQGSPLFTEAIANLGHKGIDLLVHVGDYLRNDRPDEWHNKFFRQLERRDFAQTVPMVLVRGNHNDESSADYAYNAANVENNRRPWFAFSYASCRIVVLDSNTNAKQTPAQDEWLRAEIESKEFQMAAFRIIVVHVPPFAELWDPKQGFNGDPSIRADWVPLFESHGVDLVVSGHMHAYQQGTRNGVKYVVIGGGGGSLDGEQSFNWGFMEKTLITHHYCVMEIWIGTDPFSASGKITSRLRWRTFDLHGRLIDRFELAPKKLK
eukprot:GEZU01020559.1.p1 GENE.GEZU01020559.1~~GEZU01020559.1.p1  ORF type:complete len:703 (-),score=84.93 GEZU01020559.1:58-2166(-)